MACPALSWAQPGPATTPPPLTFKSLGQPPLFKPYVAGSLTWNREGEESLGGVGVVGLYKDLVMPLSGAFGVSAEGYVGGIGSATGTSSGWDGGARLFATSRLLVLNVGVDWNARPPKAPSDARPQPALTDESQAQLRELRTPILARTREIFARKVL
jgi:hypothetical protein